MTELPAEAVPGPARRGFSLGATPLLQLCSRSPFLTALANLFPTRATPEFVFRTPRQVSIRPFTHSEYERFLVAAYPYYASALSVMVGFLMFCAAFLYSKDDAPGKSTW